MLEESEWHVLHGIVKTIEVTSMDNRDQEPDDELAASITDDVASWSSMHHSTRSRSVLGTNEMLEVHHLKSADSQAFPFEISPRAMITETMQSRPAPEKEGLRIRSSRSEAATLIETTYDESRRRNALD